MKPPILYIDHNSEGRHARDPGGPYSIADRLINGLLKNNVKPENIYVDPLVQPLSVNNTFGFEFLDAIEKIMTIAKSLYGAIVNPLDKKMMANIIAAMTLAGKDSYCMEYLKAFRANVLDF